jgi:hypothetical protein
MAGLHFTDVSSENIGSLNGRKTESLAGLRQLPTKDNGGVHLSHKSLCSSWKLAPA